MTRRRSTGSSRARRDRYYVKKFEEETNLECHLLLDVSASMGYSSQAVSKLEYGSFVLAALAYLMHRKRDAVALTLFDHQVVDTVPAGARSGHLRRVLARLSRAAAGTRSDVAMPLHRLAARMQRRGLVVLVSDLLDEPAGIIEGLKHLRFRGSDVLVFQVLDPAELTFPFEEAARFRDLESADEMPVVPARVRKHYLAQIDALVERYREALRPAGIDLPPPAYGPSPGHGAARVSRGARGGGGEWRSSRRRSCSARWPSRCRSSCTSCGANVFRACRSATCASCAARGVEQTRRQSPARAPAPRAPGGGGAAARAGVRAPVLGGPGRVRRARDGGAGRHVLQRVRARAGGRGARAGPRGGRCGSRGAARGGGGVR